VFFSGNWGNTTTATAIIIIVIIVVLVVAVQGGRGSIFVHRVNNTHVSFSADRCGTFVAGKELIHGDRKDRLAGFAAFVAAH